MVCITVYTSMCIFLFQRIWVCAQDCYIWMTSKLHFKLSWTSMLIFLVFSPIHLPIKSPEVPFLSPSILYTLCDEQLFDSSPFTPQTFVTVHFAINPDIGFWAFLFICSMLHMLCVHVCQASVRQSQQSRQEWFSSLICGFSGLKSGHWVWQQVPASAMPSSWSSMKLDLTFLHG